MDQQFKPEGYNSASPYFIVNGAQQMIDLLVQLFGARLLRRYDMPDGAIMHAEIMIDDTVIMLGEASDKFPATACVMHVYVSDADAAYERALSLGCTSVEPPRQREGDPDRRGTFRDFAGNLWSVGTQL